MTHAITGAALSTLTPNNPLVGFTVGFASHFVLDSIPHWDYELKSSKKNKERPLENDLVINKDFIKDIIKILADGIIGLILALAIFTLFRHHSLITTLFAAIGAMLPDALQFVYFKWRHEPLVSLQKFHIWMHARSDLKSQPILGISSQILIIVIFVLLLK